MIYLNTFGNLKSNHLYEIGGREGERKREMYQCYISYQLLCIYPRYSFDVLIKV